MTLICRCCLHVWVLVQILNWFGIHHTYYILLIFNKGPPKASYWEFLCVPKVWETHADKIKILIFPLILNWFGIHHTYYILLIFNKGPPKASYWEFLCVPKIWETHADKIKILIFPLRHWKFPTVSIHCIYTVCIYTVCICILAGFSVQ